MQHRQHRGRSHASTEQDDRAEALPECKGAPWSTHLQHIAHLHLVVYVRAGCAVRLLLDAHPVVIGTWRVGERVVGQERWCACLRSHAQYPKLPGPATAERFLVRWPHDQDP